MTVLQSDIDALTEALATGERLVRHGDKTVEYRSIAEIREARSLLIAEKTAQDDATSTAPRPRQTRLYHSGRGY